MSDISDDDESKPTSTDMKFNKAADYVQSNHSNLTSNQLLEIYGLYKQSTIGECNQPKPGIFNLQGRSKWNAWKSLGNMDKCTAMEFYVKKVIESGWIPDQINENKKKKSDQWVCHSVPIIDDSDILPEDKTVIDFIKDNDLEKLKKQLNIDEINKLSDEGMGLIHYSADRGSDKILEFLLKSGANVNLLDQDEQTALHYAASCGHVECAKILLKFGVNKDLRDNEKQSSFDVAYDNQMKELLDIK